MNSLKNAGDYLSRSIHNSFKQKVVENVKEDVSSHFEENRKSYILAGSALALGIAIGFAIKKPQIIQHIHVLTN